MIKREIVGKYLESWSKIRDEYAWRISNQISRYISNCNTFTRDSIFFIARSKDYPSR